MCRCLVGLSAVNSFCLLSLSSAPDNGSPAVKFCDRILDLEKNRLCVIIGTLWKEMTLKPSIMDEYKGHKADCASVPASSSSSSASFSSSASSLSSSALSVAPSLPSSSSSGVAPNYCSPDDRLALEDEGGRVRLICRSLDILNPAHLVTGMCV